MLAQQKGSGFGQPGLGTVGCPAVTRGCLEGGEAGSCHPINPSDAGACGLTLRCQARAENQA